MGTCWPSLGIRPAPWLPLQPGQGALDRAKDVLPREEAADAAPEYPPLEYGLGDPRDPKEGEQDRMAGGHLQALRDQPGPGIPHPEFPGTGLLRKLDRRTPGRRDEVLHPVADGTPVGPGGQIEPGPVPVEVRGTDPGHVKEAIEGRLGPPRRTGEDGGRGELIGGVHQEDGGVPGRLHRPGHDRSITWARSVDWRASANWDEGRPNLFAEKSWYRATGETTG